MIIGLALYLVLLALYVAALVAVCAGVAARRRPRPAMASFARWAGRASFAYAFAWVMFFAEVWRSETARMAYPLAVLGLLAWWLGIAPGQRAERVAFSVVSIGCPLVAAAFIWHAVDYRQRSDAVVAATRLGDLFQVRHLLSTGISPNGAGDHALLRIAPNAETMRVLLEAGAKVEAAPGALELAVQRGDYDQVKMLLEHGADPNSRGGGDTAARYAWRRKDQKILELLGRAGARDAAKYQRLTGALLGAVEARDEGAVKESLAGEYALDEAEDGLHVAADRGYTSIALLLARKTPAYGEIGEAMLFAARTNHPGTFEVLIDELASRQPGFVGREMKAQALALARAKRFHDIERIAVAKGAEPGATNPFALSADLTGPWRPLAAGILLIYERSGCPAGTRDVLTVHENGSLELVNRNGNRRARSVTPARLAPILQLFGQNDLGPLHLQYQSEFEPPAGGSDSCVSRVTARTRTGASRTVTTTDAARAPKFLKSLVSELDSLSTAPLSSLSTKTPVFMFESSGCFLKGNLASGEWTQISNHGFDHTPSIVPSADGRWISYSGGLKNRSAEEYWLYDKRSGSDRLYHTAAGRGGIPEFSPDSKWITLVADYNKLWPSSSGAGLYLISAETLASSLLENPSTVAIPKNGAMRFVTWSKDGSELLLHMRAFPPGVEQTREHFSYRMTEKRHERIEGEYDPGGEKFFRGGSLIAVYEQPRIQSELRSERGEFASPDGRWTATINRDYELTVRSKEGATKKVSVGTYNVLHQESTISIIGWLDSRHLVYSLHSGSGFHVFDTVTGRNADLFSGQDSPAAFFW